MSFLKSFYAFIIAQVLDIRVGGTYLANVGTYFILSLTKVLKEQWVLPLST